MQSIAGSETDTLVALVVDDDAAARQFVSMALGFEGYTTDQAADGTEALDLLARERYDVVVLDADLPGTSGISVLRQLRETLPVAVVMLSASDDSVLRVVGLELGADDFCTKPITERELALRVQLAVQRRRYTQAVAEPVIISREGLTIDPVSRIAVLDGAELDLTLKEFDLLSTVAAAPGRVFSRGELLEQVWETKPDWQSVDTVTEHVYRLRQKLDATGSTRSWIETVRGAGYRFAASGAGAAGADRLRSAQ